MKSKKNPIILIPGMVGSKLEAKNKSKKRHIHLLCRKWKTIWLANLYPLTINQILRLLRLRWNLAYRHPVNFCKDICIRPVNFGGLRGVRYLNKWSKNFTFVYYFLIKYLRKKYHYKPNRNLFGAPYDFRVVPCFYHLNQYYEALDGLVEKAHRKNKKKVILVSHSLGSCLICNYLSNKSCCWKEKYIHKWISISAPLGGSMESLRTLLYGDYNTPFNFLIDASLLRKVLTVYPSVFYLLPCGEVFGWDKPLIVTDKKTFEVQDRDELFELFNIKNYDLIRESIPKLWYPQNLGIKIVFVYSDGIPTLDYMTAGKDSTVEIYNEKLGDGDGTVNLVSLKACEYYKCFDPENVQIRVIKNEEHQKILKSSELFEIFDEFLKL